MRETNRPACFPSSRSLFAQAPRWRGLILALTLLWPWDARTAEASESLSNLHPIRDTYVSENNLNSSFGSNRFGLLGDIAGNSILFLQYNLAAIPPGSTVVTATLSFQKAFTDHSGPMTIELRQRREAWNESTVTWSSSQPLGDPLYGTASLNTNLSFPLITDGPLKALVQEWIDDPSSNHGLAIGPASLTGTYISFHMREDVPAAQPIRLSVSYEPPGSAPPPANLLANPSFEQGTTGWTCNGCTHVREFGVVADGQESAFINGRAGSWAGPTQTITQPLTNGATYTVSGLVRTTRSQGSIARFTFYLNTTAGVQYVSGPQASVLPTQFTQVSGDVTLQWSGTLLEARVYVETSGDNAAFYLDNVNLAPHGSPPPPPPPPASNLLVNPSFEQGTTGWTCNGCTHIREFGTVADGQESAFINGRAGSWAGPTQTITQSLTNGATYTVSGLVRTTRPQGSTARFTFYLNTTAGVQYVSAPQASVLSTQFTPVSGNVTLQWSGTLLEARVYMETSGDNAAFYLDNVVLSETP